METFTIHYTDRDGTPRVAHVKALDNAAALRRLTNALEPLSVESVTLD